MLKEAFYTLYIPNYIIVYVYISKNINKMLISPFKYKYLYHNLYFTTLDHKNF